MKREISTRWVLLRITAGLMLWCAPLASNGQFFYITNNGAITITGQDEFAPPVETLIVPDTIDGLPVTSIGDNAFNILLATRTLVIGNNVTNLGANAVDNWPNLTNIVFGNSLVTIGDDNFWACDRLANVNIPNTVISIGTYDFSNDASLTNVVIGEGLTNIGSWAFYYCANLESFSAAPQNQFFSTEDGVLFDKKEAKLVRCPEAKPGSYKIPDTVTDIGFAAFFGCAGLTNVGMSTNLIRIESEAFDSCGLTSLTLPNSLQAIGAIGFADCTKLTSVSVPGSVVTIEVDAFNFCPSLTNLTLNNGIANISGSAFAYCSRLPAVTIPASVTNIDLQAFWACGQLAAFVVDPQNSFYNSVDGGLYDKNGTVLIQLPPGKGGNYIIPDKVTAIGPSACENCGTLSGVTMPDSLTNIGNGAFDSCGSLSTVIFPASLQSIGNDAFWKCYSLTNAYFRGNAPSFGDSIFGFEQLDPIWLSADPVTLYYLPGTTGWASVVDERPAELWRPSMVAERSSGISSVPFQFAINWASGMEVVVQATSDLGNPIWRAVVTNKLSSDSIRFTDLQSTNYYSRFYRLTWP